jgi:hypothetical protein
VPLFSLRLPLLSFWETSSLKRWSMQNLSSQSLLFYNPTPLMASFATQLNLGQFHLLKPGQELPLCNFHFSPSLGANFSFLWNRYFIVIISLSESPQLSSPVLVLASFHLGIWNYFHPCSLFSHNFCITKLRSSSIYLLLEYQTFLKRLKKL